MSDPYPEGSKRKMDENGEVLLSDGDWNLENYDGDDGPVMYHKPCKMWTIELNRQYPQCVSCGMTIPSSLIAPFCLMNWEYANNPEYFVPFSEEEEAHAVIHSGHRKPGKRNKGGLT